MVHLLCVVPLLCTHMVLTLAKFQIWYVTHGVQGHVVFVHDVDEAVGRVRLEFSCCFYLLEVIEALDI